MKFTVKHFTGKVTYNSTGEQCHCGGKMFKAENYDSIFCIYCNNHISISTYTPDYFIEIKKTYEKILLLKEIKEL